MRASIKSPLSVNEDLSKDYYNQYAEKYVDSTLDVDLIELYQRFLKYIPQGAKILDAGSGSGRDTLAFIASGYNVEAFDSSSSLCELSTQLTGINTRLLRFQDFEDVDKYDGIWACASLLHVPEKELHDVICRLLRSLKHNGAMYMSFKYGAGERIASDGRFYTDMNVSRLKSLLKDNLDIKIVEIWVSQGEGDFKGQAQWLNAIILKDNEDKLLEQ